MVTETEKLETLMQQIINNFQPEKANGVNAKIQFHISGNLGSDWVATIQNQKLNVEKGTISNPNLTLSAEIQDLLKLAQGKLNPMQAFMQGKVQIKGDIALAMRLVDLFKRP
jgi:putative sterol carrier protein